MSTILVGANWVSTHFYSLVQRGSNDKDDGPYLVSGQKFNNLFRMDPGMYQDQERGKEDENTEDGKKQEIN